MTWTVAFTEPPDDALSRRRFTADELGGIYLGVGPRDVLALVLFVGRSGAPGTCATIARVSKRHK